MTAKSKRKMRNIKSKKKVKGGALANVKATGCIDPGKSSVVALSCNDFGYIKTK